MGGYIRGAFKTDLLFPKLAHCSNLFLFDDVFNFVPSEVTNYSDPGHRKTLVLCKGGGTLPNPR